ncbi:MAG: hypothetical protein ACTSPY_05060 [Candidatus Helarchaeota archaeon]
MIETEENIDKTYDKILEFVKELKPPTIHEYRDKYKIIIPYVFEFKNKETITLLVDTRIGKKWVEIKCLLLMKKVLPKIPQLENILHEKLLQANFNYAEVTYSIDSEGNVFAEADMPVKTDIINFKSEFVSILFAIENFFNQIIPSVSNEIKKVDTYEPNMFT